MLVEDVAAGDRDGPRPLRRREHRIEQRDRWGEEGLARVDLVADVANARAGAQLPVAADGEGLRSPDRGQVARLRGEAVARGKRLARGQHLGVGVAVGGGQLEILRHAHDRLELEPLGAHRTALNEVLDVARVLGDIVGFLDVVIGGAEQRALHRLPLHAAFILPRGARDEGVAEEVAAGDGKEGLGIVEIGRHALDHFDDYAAAERPGDLRQLRHAVALRGRPVAAEAEHNMHPVGVAHLVLHVEAELRALVVEEVERPEIERRAILRIVDVDRRRRAERKPGRRDDVVEREAFVLVLLEPGVVDAEQHLVLNRPCRDVDRQVVVAVEDAAVLVVHVEFALQQRFSRIRPGIGGVVGVDFLIVGVHVAVARGAAEGDVVAELLRQDQRDRAIFGVHPVEAGLALVEVERDPLGLAVGKERLVERHIAERALHVLLVEADQRDVGAGRGLETKRRVDEQAVVGGAPLRLAVAQQADEARRDAVAERARDVDLALDALVGAGEDSHLAAELELRPLADRVEHTARAARAVEHGGRAAQHLGPLQRERLEPRAIDEVGHPLEPVEILRRVEATGHDEVAARVHAVVGGDTGAVAVDVLKIDDRAVADFLGGDHADRLRRLDERRVGLGRRDRALGGDQDFLVGPVLPGLLGGRAARKPGDAARRQQRDPHAPQRPRPVRPGPLAHLQPLSSPRRRSRQHFGLAFPADIHAQRRRSAMGFGG